MAKRFPDTGRCLCYLRYQAPACWTPAAGQDGTPRSSPVEEPS
jgi:hypothetical protein